MVKISCVYKWNKQEAEVEYVEGYDDLEEEDDIEDFGDLGIDGPLAFDGDNGKYVIQCFLWSIFS